MTKAITFAIAILLSATVVSAQTQKGSQTLGVSATYYHQDTKQGILNPNTNVYQDQNMKTTIFGIAPGYSYFIADNVDIGTVLSYSYNKSSYESPSSNSNSQSGRSYGASLFLRKYFLYQGKLGIRTGPYFHYGWGDGRNDFGAAPSGENKTTNRGYAAGANVDLVYFPTKSFGVTASLADASYAHSTTKYENNSLRRDKNDVVNLSLINNGLTLGVIYVFGQR